MLSYKRKDEIKSEYVHGYLTAILCAREMIVPSVWLPLLLPILLLADSNSLIDKNKINFDETIRELKEAALIDIPVNVTRLRAYYQPDLKKPVKETEVKTGRNDPCPCGSGKKFKKCCGLH